MEERRINEYLEKELMELQTVAKLHVDKNTFTWTVGVFSVVLASLLGVMYGMIKDMDAQHSAKIDALERSQANNNVDSAKIMTQLAQIQADLQELKATLKDHSK